MGNENTPSLMGWGGSLKGDFPSLLCLQEVAACVQWVVEVSRTLGWL